MTRPVSKTTGDWSVRSLHWLDGPAFAYLRQTRRDFDGQAIFHLYTAHSVVRDRQWVKSFVRDRQAVIWAGWHTIELLAASEEPPGATLEALRRS